MSTTLFLTRHGETIWHAENRYAGVSDVPLSEHGQEQAKRLGSWAADERLDAVWSSPLTRARATAAPAAAALGRPITVDASLTEVCFGIAEGRTLAELPDDDVAAFLADPVTGAFPGAEDPREATARGTAALHRIADRHPAERVLVVAHNTLLRLVLCELLGAPLERYRRIFPRLHNTACTQVEIDGGDAGLIMLNAPLP